MSQRRLNLFLIGSMKSGTTYLSELLGAHPAIFMSTPKEPCHFVDGKALRQVWPSRWELGYWRSLERYLSLFTQAGLAPVVAEASIVYSHAPICSGVPARILALSPEARFIYIMRDPIERTISHYWHSVRWWRESRPVLEAIRAEPRYTDVSYYALQLKEYLRHVELGRIYTLTYEGLLADPAHELSRLYSWLGVDPSFRPSGIGVPSNERPDVVEQVRGLGLLDRMRRSPAYGEIARFVPGIVRRLGNQLAARSVRPDDVPLAAVQLYLRSLQQRQTEELSALLDRGFPEWTTLYENSAPTAGAPELRLIRARAVSAGRGNAG